jgi:hypothetical protein
VEKACAQRFQFQRDMNGDYQFTITDVWEMVRYVYYAPGDGMVCLFYGTEFGRFMEFSSNSLQGLGSGVFSGIVWFVLLVFVLIGMAVS